MNYPQLRAAIQEYSENFESSFVDNIDTFIRLAESRIALRVKLPKFRKDVTAQLTGPNPLPNQLLTVPTDFLAPESFATLTSSGLVLAINKDPEFIDECYPNPAQMIGPPRFYALLNESTLKLGPAPDLNYVAQMGYFYQPPSIVDSGTSWLGDHFSHALITGSLVEACVYMKTEDNLWTRYSGAFDKDVAMDDAYAKGRTKKDTYQDPDTRIQA
jgi:hypothetical protein